MASTRRPRNVQDQTALIVEVPAAEPLVARFRAQFDPSAAAGVPAHVTVLYPFLSPSDLTAAGLRTLTRLFRDMAPFDAKLTRIRSFPGVLYLAPAPARPFQRLTQLVNTCFPQAPPYGGRFADIVPHLTVADVGSSKVLAEIDADFRAAAAGRLPIRVSISTVALFVRHDGRWRRRRVFRLGRAIVRRRGRRKSAEN
jgi:2'-5' RNA ligase